MKQLLSWRQHLLRLSLFFITLYGFLQLWWRRSTTDTPSLGQDEANAQALVVTSDTLTCLMGMVLQSQLSSALGAWVALLWCLPSTRAASLHYPMLERDATSLTDIRDYASYEDRVAVIDDTGLSVYKRKMPLQLQFLARWLGPYTGVRWFQKGIIVFESGGFSTGYSASLSVFNQPTSNTLAKLSNLPGIYVLDAIMNQEQTQLWLAVRGQQPTLVVVNVTEWPTLTILQSLPIPLQIPAMQPANISLQFVPWREQWILHYNGCGPVQEPFLSCETGFVVLNDTVTGPVITSQLAWPATFTPNNMTFGHIRDIYRSRIPGTGYGYMQVTSDWPVSPRQVGLASGLYALDLTTQPFTLFKRLSLMNTAQFTWHDEERVVLMYHTTAAFFIHLENWLGRPLFLFKTDLSLNTIDPAQLTTTMPTIIQAQDKTAIYGPLQSRQWGLVPLNTSSILDALPFPAAYAAPQVLPYTLNQVSLYRLLAHYGVNITETIPEQERFLSNWSIGFSKATWLSNTSSLIANVNGTLKIFVLQHTVPLVAPIMMLRSQFLMPGFSQMLVNTTRQLAFFLTHDSNALKTAWLHHPIDTSQWIWNAIGRLPARYTDSKKAQLIPHHQLIYQYSTQYIETYIVNVTNVTQPQYVWKIGESILPCTMDTTGSYLFSVVEPQHRIKMFNLKNLTSPPRESWWGRSGNGGASLEVYSIHMAYRQPWLYVGGDGGVSMVNHQNNMSLLNAQGFRPFVPIINLPGMSVFTVNTDAADRFLFVGGWGNSLRIYNITDTDIHVVLSSFLKVGCFMQTTRAFLTAPFIVVSCGDNWRLVDVTHPDMPYVRSIYTIPPLGIGDTIADISLNEPAGCIYVLTYQGTYVYAFNPDAYGVIPLVDQQENKSQPVLQSGQGYTGKLAFYQNPENSSHWLSRPNITAVDWVWGNGTAQLLPSWFSLDWVSYIFNILVPPEMESQITRLRVNISGGFVSSAAFELQQVSMTPTLPDFTMHEPESSPEATTFSTPPASLSPPPTTVLSTTVPASSSQKPVTTPPPSTAVEVVLTFPPTLRPGETAAPTESSSPQPIQFEIIHNTTRPFMQLITGTDISSLTLGLQLFNPPGGVFMPIPGVLANPDYLRGLYSYTGSLVQLNTMLQQLRLSLRDDRSEMPILVAYFDKITNQWQSLGQVDLKVFGSNTAPQVLNQTLPEVIVQPQEVLNFQLPDTVFYDAEGDPMQFITKANQTDLPDWIQFTSTTHRFRGRAPRDEDVTLNMTVRPTDGFKEAQVVAYFMLMVRYISPYVLKEISALVFKLGQPFSYEIPTGIFSRSDLIYDVRGEQDQALPKWLTFDARSNRLSGKAEEEGEITLRVEAMDSIRYGTANTTLRLRFFDEPPRFNNTIIPPMARAGRIFNYEIPSGTVIDQDNTILQWTCLLKEGLPLYTWMSFQVKNKATFQEPQFTANIPVNYAGQTIDLVLKVSDGFKAVDMPWTLVVAANHAPFIPIAWENFTVNMGEYFLRQFKAADIDNDTLTYRVQEQKEGALHPLPPSINAGSLDEITGYLSGQPQEDDLGTHHLNIEATDGVGGNVRQTVTMTVKRSFLKELEYYATIVGSVISGVLTAYGLYVKRNALLNMLCRGYLKPSEFDDNYVWKLPFKKPHVRTLRYASASEHSVLDRCLACLVRPFSGYLYDLLTLAPLLTDAVLPDWMNYNEYTQELSLDLVKIQRCPIGAGSVIVFIRTLEGRILRQFELSPDQIKQERRYQTWLSHQPLTSSSQPTAEDYTPPPLPSPASPVQGVFKREDHQVDLEMDVFQQPILVLPTFNGYSNPLPTNNTKRFVGGGVSASSMQTQQPSNNPITHVYAV